MWAEEKSRSTAVYFQKINSPSSIHTLPGLTMTCFEKANKNKISRHLPTGASLSCKYLSTEIKMGLLITSFHF